MQASLQIDKSYYVRGSTSYQEMVIGQASAEIKIEASMLARCA